MEFILSQGDQQATSSGHAIYRRLSKNPASNPAQQLLFNSCDLLL
jgi:hypothetical protein